MNVADIPVTLIAQAAAGDVVPTASHGLVVMGIAIIAFIMVGLGMALGIMFGRKPISGSCGGIGNVTNEDGETSCSLCQNPGEACKELRRRMTDTNDQPAT